MKIIWTEIADTDRIVVEGRVSELNEMANGRQRTPRHCYSSPEVS
jgi:hypothetical protein